MKEDVKMKDIKNTVPGGTMPQVGAKQYMQAAPKTSPAQTAPKASPAQMTPKASPAQTSQNVSPAQTASKVSPEQANEKVSPAQATPKASPVQTIPNVSPVQEMPGLSPFHAMPDMMPVQSMANMMPVQSVPDDMPVQAGPAGMMPQMMNQIPIMCCPYLMNMQCPMIYGANVMGMNMMNNGMLSGISPATGNMMPYAGNAEQMMGAANNNMYALPSIGTMPSMNNQYFPMGGMNY